MTDIFRFKKFQVKQQQNVFKIGTDAVLLALLIPIETTKQCLEIGCGCGVISLILAQRNANTTFTAIDIDNNAFELAKYNFQHSPFLSQITAIFGDIRRQNFNTMFDMIVCNPPFFSSNTTLHQQYSHARQQLTLSYDDLLYSILKNITSTGKAFVIIPAEDKEAFLQKLRERKLFINFLVDVFGIVGGKIKRCIIGFSLQETIIFHQDFFIEQSPRKYTEAYKNLGKDFYLKF